MSKNTKPEGDMLQGTLDMLILRTLLAGPAHGHSIAHAIEFASDDILQVEHGISLPGSLSPGRSRLDRGILGHVRKQSKSQILSPDTGWQKASHCGENPVGASRERHYSCLAARCRIAS